MGSKTRTSTVVGHGLSSGIFSDQGSNPCWLHWQADSLPLSHEGSPTQKLVGSSACNRDKARAASVKCGKRLPDPTHSASPCPSQVPHPHRGSIFLGFHKSQFKTHWPRGSLMAIPVLGSNDINTRTSRPGSGFPANLYPSSQDGSYTPFSMALPGGQASTCLDASANSQQSVMGLSPGGLSQGGFHAPSSGLQLLARVTLSPYAAFHCGYLPVHPENSRDRKDTSVPGSAQHQAQPRQALRTGGTEWVSAQPSLEHDEQGPKPFLDSLRASFDKYLLSNYSVVVGTS